MTDHEWAFLQPLLQCLPMMWCHGVDSRLAPTNTIVHVTVPQSPTDADGDGQSDSNTINDGDHRLATWRRCVDALELLALLARVDLRAWTQILDALHAMSVPHDMDLGADATTGEPPLPVYALSFYDNDTPEIIELFLDVLFSPSPCDESNVEFNHAKFKLQCALQEKTAEPTETTFPIPVSLDCDGEHPQHHDAILHWYCTRLLLDGELARRSHLRSMGVSHFHGRMGATWIDRIHHQTSPEIGIPLREISLGITGFEPATTRLEQAQFWSDLLGASGAQCVDSRNMGDATDAYESFFSALLSEPLFVASRLRSLRLVSPEFGDTPAERRSKWLWLLLGLFSDRAHHTILHVEIALAMSPELVSDLHWIKELLTVQRMPRTELLIGDVFDEFATRDEPPCQEQHWLTVPRGQVIRLERTGDWRDHALVFEDDKRFLVLRDDPTWAFVDILVPVYGRCFVERPVDVPLRLSTSPVAPWTFESHSVESLNLGVSEMDAHERRLIVELLALVGAPVGALTLSRWTSVDSGEPGVMDYAFLSAVARSCPRLQVLELSGTPIASAQALIQIYDQSLCAATTLDLSNGAFPSVASMLELLETLSTNDTHSRKITHSLHELSVSLAEYDVTEMEHTAFTRAVVAMLEANRVLRAVRVGLSQDQYTARKHLVLAHDQTPIPVQKTPLTMRCKCAFLSVAVAQQVDAPVLTRVFAFAAECETRSVSVYSIH